MKGKYDDIINMPHHVSAKRPQMSMQDRAAQFSPFAALTGYGAAIKETARLTDSPAELSEEELSILNIKFQTLLEHLREKPPVSFTYFKPDEKKSGGKYVTLSGRVKKADTFKRLVVMEDDTKIPMDDILDMEGEIFESLQ